MAETPLDKDPVPEQPRKFGEDIRLKVFLSEDFRVETTGLAEFNQIDLWRHQGKKLMEELLWLGISQEDSFGHEVTVARPRERRALQEILHDLVVRNRFNPSYRSEIATDKSAIERECDIKLGQSYWTHLNAFKAYWQGQYKPDAARRSLLQRTVQKEREKHTDEEDVSFKDRALYWIQFYFEGCCPQEVEVPEHQDSRAVLEILDRDFELVSQLHLGDGDQEEVIRMLTIDFISGRYPIIAGKIDPASEEAMLRVLERMTLSGQTDATTISMVFQRYRNCVAQDLDFEDEEQKREEERAARNRIDQKDFERRQHEYGIEAEFLATLDLPELEADDWSAYLLQIANSPYFKVNPAYRENVHAHVRWFIEQMPWENETGGEDPWSVLTCMLKNYWGGRYHRDDLRWRVLQEECAKAPKGLSQIDDGTVVSTFLLHEKFIRGCEQAGAKMNASQDAELLQFAYDNDMKLLRNLGISEAVLRKMEWEYNKYLLEGNLPLAIDREMPADREEIERKLKAHIEEMKGTEWEANTSEVLQIFLEHWYPISRRPAPRKE